MRVAGFVLVGGRSSRMGRDKARLLVNSRLLVEAVAEKVSAAAERVALIGAADRYRDLPFDRLDDVRSGLGPLAGIETALQSTRGELNLIVACDMPDLDPQWLRQLVAHAAKRASCCVISQDSDGTRHPLCSVWDASCLPAVSAALDCGHLRVSGMAEALNADVLVSLRPLRNINTPSEWKAWQDHTSENSESSVCGSVVCGAVADDR